MSLSIEQNNLTSLSRMLWRVFSSSLSQELSWNGWMQLDLFLWSFKVTASRLTGWLRTFTETVILKSWHICIILIFFYFFYWVCVFKYGAQINTLRYLPVFFILYDPPLWSHASLSLYELKFCFDSRLQDLNIEIVDSLRYLCVHINNKLGWSSHNCHLREGPQSPPPAWEAWGPSWSAGTFYDTMVASAVC